MKLSYAIACILLLNTLSNNSMTPSAQGFGPESSSIILHGQGHQELMDMQKEIEERQF